MRKQGIILFILLALLAVCIAGSADATPRKKKKEKRHEKKHERKHERKHEKKHEKKQESKRETRRESRRARRRAKRLEAKYSRERKLPEQPAPVVVVATEPEQYSKKEERKRDHTQRDYQYETGYGSAYQEPATAPRPFKYPPTVMKPRYRIDVLASMYLDELVKKGEVAFKDKIPDKALPGISLYEGLTIAADSLKKAGFNIDIYIHDVASAAESPEMLVSNGKLDSADLIIGAVRSHEIAALADYAKEKKVNFISVMSPSDGGVTRNKYLTVIQPTLKSHCEWILSDVSKKFPGMNVALLYRSSEQGDDNAYKYLTDDHTGKVRLAQLLCNTLPGKQNLAPLFDTTKPNVVIIPVLDPAYADSILDELSYDFPSTHFEVYGMPSWVDIPDLLNEDAFPNLSVNVTAPFNIDVTSPVGKYVARAYKKDYNGKITEYVYRGFETMFWYANLLKRYGTMFNPEYNDNSTAPFTKFEVKQQRDDDGHILFNENTHVYLLKYEGGYSKVE